MAIPLPAGASVDRFRRDLAAVTDDRPVAVAVSGGPDSLALLLLAAAAGVEPVDDPSNADLAFDRVRMRRQIADTPWLDVPALARSASALAQADAALDAIASRLFDRRPSASGEACVSLDPAGLPD